MSNNSIQITTQEELNNVLTSVSNGITGLLDQNDKVRESDRLFLAVIQEEITNYYLHRKGMVESASIRIKPATAKTITSILELGIERLEMNNIERSEKKFIKHFEDVLAIWHEEVPQI